MKLPIVVPFSWFGALLVIYTKCCLKSAVFGPVHHKISAYVRMVDIHTNFMKNRTKNDQFQSTYHAYHKLGPKPTERNDNEQLYQNVQAARANFVVGCYVSTLCHKLIP